MFLYSAFVEISHLGQNETFMSSLSSMVVTYI